MGTSTSSSGPGPGVSFDPPWLDQIGGGESGSPATPTDGAKPDGTAVPVAAQGSAPPRRFVGARRELKRFANTGDRHALSRAAGHYSKSGMGGAKNVAARMRMSTRSATGLVGLLQAARDGTNPEVNRWVSDLSAGSPNVQDVIHEIIRQVTSGGGSVDEEACNDSMAQAMAELLENNPDVELLSMDNADIWVLVELFLSNEACSRMHLDIGQLFESSNLPPRQAVQRVNEMRDFLKSEIGAQLETLRAAQPDPTPTELEKLMRDALKLTFTVYEGEV